MHRLIIHSDDGQDCKRRCSAEYNYLTHEYGGASGEPKSFSDTMDDFEKNIIAEALKKYGSTYKAADALQMSQSQLMRKKKKYHL